MSAINIEIHAGASIETASKDAQRVSDLLGISCRFSFNGVTCVAVPNGSHEELAERQQYQQSRSLRSPHDLRFATSRVEA